MSILWNEESDQEERQLESISSEEETASACDGVERNRNKRGTEIWSDGDIWERLQHLPEADEVNSLLERNETTNDDEVFKRNHQTILFLSIWLEEERILKKVLEKKPEIIHDRDSFGWSALHLAAFVGNTECLKVLLNSGGVDVNLEENLNEATPLHCAAIKGNLSCLKLLIKYGADVNAGLNKKSPLHYAVQSHALECVKELLENHANPNTSQIYSETPLHVAASLGAPDLLSLLLSHGAAVEVQYGPDKLTPLHLAAEDGDPECARLLIDAGAFLHARNHRQQTPLHLAALSQAAEALELLLRRGANPNAADSDGRTPLHCAIVKVSRSCECVRLLLGAGADPNRQDCFGYTPLHLAALNEFSTCVLLLLNHGGDVTVRTKGGVSVLGFITRKTPDVVPKYLAKFDSSIMVVDHEIGDVDCELKLDFKVLVPTMCNKETELLLNFIEVGHREILNHPLCETFLFLKWRRIRKFFLFSLFYHTLFVLLYSFYVIGVYVKNCPSARDLHTAPYCAVNKEVKISGYLVLSFTTVLLAKELFQICHSWRTYVRQWENWLQWLIILSAFFCVQPRLQNIRENVASWQHHAAALGIFLAWLELMMIVGRFPTFGLYIQMFTRVAVNFVKFLMAYSCLFLAFALCFGVLFANYKSFSDLKWVIIKVLVMLSGELEYEDIFYDDNAKILYRYTAQIMFLTFVMLVTVILANLMVGLAVSDIQGLQMSAGLDRLVRQAELVAHLESMLFSRLLRFMPHKLMRFFHKQALLLKSHYHWALHIKPNDPREERIPKDLIKNIYKLVAERKEKPKKKIRSYNKLKSPLLSRINSVMSGVGREKQVREELGEVQKEFLLLCKALRERVEAIAK